MGADCIYLESVQFPEQRAGTAQYFTEDDASLNKNLVLLSFIERAVKSAGQKPVILGTPLSGIEGGNADKWGGTVFDTAAPVSSPLIAKPEDGDYISYVKAKSAELNETVKNNFSTIKVIPTVQNQPDDTEFFKNLSQNGSDSYIIIP